MEVKDRAEIKRRFQTVMEILSSGSAPIAKLRSVGGLLSGLNPRVDGILKEYDKNLGVLEQLSDGDLVTLSAERLPEGTEEEKKRKRVVLAFLRFKEELASEIARVEKEMDSAKSESGEHDASMWGRIFGAAKGPLALATVFAVVVGVMHTTAVSVLIENAGCATIDARTAVPVSIPGLKLPNGPIPTNGTATAVFPPLLLTVDGTAPGVLSFSALAFDLSIQLSSSITDVTWNGAPLIGKKSEIKLSERKEHVLRVTCGV